VFRIFICVHGIKESKKKENASLINIYWLVFMRKRFSEIRSAYSFDKELKVRYIRCILDKFRVVINAKFFDPVVEAELSL